MLWPPSYLTELAFGSFHHNAWYAVSHNLEQEAEFIWHDATHLGDVDAVIIPGGFAYGDYLRCGAIAKFSSVMQAIRRLAAEGGLSGWQR